VLFGGGTKDTPRFNQTWALACYPGSCPADFNRDGSIDSLDFIEYLNAFNFGCP